MKNHIALRSQDSIYASRPTVKGRYFDPIFLFSISLLLRPTEGKAGKKVVSGRNLVTPLLSLKYIIYWQEHMRDSITLGTSDDIFLDRDCLNIVQNLNSCQPSFVY